MQDDSVASTVRTVRRRNIRKQSGKVPAVARNVKERKPRFTVGIEPLGSSARQRIVGRAVPVALVDVKQESDIRLALGRPHARHMRRTVSDDDQQRFAPPRPDT